MKGFILIELGILHDWQGEYEPALRLLEQSATIGHAHNLCTSCCGASFVLAWPVVGRGSMRRRCGRCKEGLELSERLGDKIHKGRILNALGWVYGELYDLERALRYNRAGAEAAYAIGDPEIIRNVEINLGDCYRLAGDLEQAQFYLEKVSQDTQRRGTPGEEWMKWRYAQHLYHSLGELWLTRAMLCRPCSVPRRAWSWPWQPSRKIWSRVATAGQHTAVRGDCRKRKQYCKKALTIAQEIGNPPQLWQTYQALGEFFEQLGQRDQQGRPTPVPCG